MWMCSERACECVRRKNVLSFIIIFSLPSTAQKANLNTCRIYKMCIREKVVECNKDTRKKISCKAKIGHVYGERELLQQQHFKMHFEIKVVVNKCDCEGVSKSIHYMFHTRLITIISASHQTTFEQLHALILSEDKLHPTSLEIFSLWWIFFRSCRASWTSQLAQWEKHFQGFQRGKKLIDHRFET